MRWLPQWHWHVFTFWTFGTLKFYFGGACLKIYLADSLAARTEMWRVVNSVRFIFNTLRNRIDACALSNVLREVGAYQAEATPYFLFRQFESLSSRQADFHLKKFYFSFGVRRARVNKSLTKPFRLITFPITWASTFIFMLLMPYGPILINFNTCLVQCLPSFAIYCLKCVSKN